jgi:hypothetical protein
VNWEIYGRAKEREEKEYYEERYKRNHYILLSPFLSCSDCGISIVCK